MFSEDNPSKEDKLAKSKKESQTKTESKIRYLEDLGFLHRIYEGEEPKIKEEFKPVSNYKDLVKDKAKLYEYMCLATPLITKIHDFIYKNPECKLDDLTKYTGVGVDELRDSKHWLRDLGYIKEKGNPLKLTSRKDPNYLK